MNNLRTEDVSALLELLKDSDFDELHVETDEFEVYVARRGAASRRLFRASAVETASATPVPARAEAPASLVVAPDQPAQQTLRAAKTDVVQTETVTQPITAPVMGTFYRAASPGAAPFVEVGQEVTPDTTIAIIEVMKLMNQIPAGVSGVIEKILVENGALVEFNQPIMLLSPKVR